MSEFPLTPQQQAVVAYDLLPLRVAAGAGTGKTSTIARRLQSIVAGGTPPEAALGITFTNKAAGELADRLRSLLPAMAQTGREVEVTTYHGFAYSLLQEFGAYVGVERDAAVIGPGYVRQLIHESLRGESFAALDMTSPPHRIAEAATLAGQLGDNLKTSADLVTAAPEKVDEVWAARLELAKVVAGYEHEKRRLGVVDYADLILLSHRLVTEYPSIAKKVRSRFAVVLLDEYQDTAPAQRKLLEAIFGGGFPVTAVGDSDQIIYEWRGASLANFEGFPADFPEPSGTPSRTLPLTINHRSMRRILDAANAVRQEIHGGARFDRLEPDAEAGEGTVTARWFRTAVAEAGWIAEEIRRLHEEDGLAWRDMAILFRKNRQISLVRDALEAHGIPLEVASLGGLLDVPEVAELHAWLRILESPADTPALMRVLLGSRYRLGFGDVAVLARWIARHGRVVDIDDGPAWPLLEAIDHVDEIDGLRAEAHRRLVEFRGLYRSLLAQAQGVALVELCRRILDAVDAWVEVDSMEEASGLSARLNLYRFLDLAEQWSPLEGRPSLVAFLGYLELLTDERSADELDTARIGGEDAVALLTVHRAKGLEWDTVFLPALAKDIFPARSLGYDNPTHYARYLPYELRLDAARPAPLGGSKQERDQMLRAHHLRSEWRAAYVAVTRARQRLYPTGAFWYTARKPKAPSRLFEVLATCPAVDVLYAADEPGEPPERLVIPDLGGAPDPLFPDGWQAALRRAVADPQWPERCSGDGRAAYDARVDQLEIMLDSLPNPAPSEPTPQVAGTSVTGLVTMARCPQQYYWSEVERLPRRPTAALRRGVDVHRRIELHNRGQVPFEEVSDHLYDAVGVAAGADTGDADSKGGDPFAAFLDSPFAERRPRFIETPIDLKIGKGRVRGRVDAIYEPEPGLWEIVDYKTGPERSDPALNTQLEAYAVAAATGAVSPDRPEQIAVSFLYLGGDTATQVRTEVDGGWLAKAKRRLSELMEQVMGDEFPPTPSAACRRCDFRRFCETGQAYLAE
jgi:DNA helicase-2/ATP-dependent DNA helicase PcrA